MQKLTYDAAFTFSILGENGELVAYCDDDGLSKTEREDAARRLVACFNACAGIPTFLLEKDVNGQIVHMRETMQQRDELLAAAKQALDALNESVDLVQNDFDFDWRHGIPTRKAQLDGKEELLKAHRAAIGNISAAIDKVQK